MATFRLRHFSSPHVLRGISPERLLSFLGPYCEFFQSRDYELPTDATDEIDYERLVSIFMTPTEDSPGELLDALFLVDEMSTVPTENVIRRDWVPPAGVYGNLDQLAAHVERRVGVRAAL